LILSTTIAHLFRASLLLKIFLSHVTQKFKTKITVAAEILSNDVPASEHSMKQTRQRCRIAALFRALTMPVLQGLC
jgi:hypothetical protein